MKYTTFKLISSHQLFIFGSISVILFVLCCFFLNTDIAGSDNASGYLYRFGQQKANEYGFEKCESSDVMKDKSLESRGKAEEAYAFLVTRESNMHYMFQGAIFLKQLNRIDPNRDIVIMYIDAVNEIHMHLMFSFLGIPNVYFQRVHDLKLDPKKTTKKKMQAQYAGIFSKLSVWSLTAYKRVMYVDMDVVLVSDNLLSVWDKECDDLQAHICLTYDMWAGKYHKGTNVIAHGSGIMVVRPNNDLLSVMKDKVWNGWHVGHQLPEQIFMDFFFHNASFGGKMQTFTNKSFSYLPADQFWVPLEEVVLSQIHLDYFYSKSYTRSHNVFEEDNVIKQTAGSVKNAKDRAAQAMNVFRSQFIDVFLELKAQYERLACTLDKASVPESNVLVNFLSNRAGVCVQQQSNSPDSSTDRVLGEIRQSYVKHSMNKFYSLLVQFANDMPIFEHTLSEDVFQNFTKTLAKSPEICMNVLHGASLKA
eukprot:Nk52_evm2s2171 gene=Nk52_evmTU2s2171